MALHDGHGRITNTMTEMERFDYLLDVLDNPCFAALSGAVVVELLNLL